MLLHMSSFDFSEYYYNILIQKYVYYFEFFLFYKNYLTKTNLNKFCCFIKIIHLLNNYLII